MAGWHIGPVILPLNPSKVTVKQAAQVKSFGLMKKYPLLMHFGPQTKVVSLEGYLQDPNADLERDYIEPLLGMVAKPAAFHTRVFDEESGFWALETITAATNSLAVSLADEASQVRRGNRSAKITATSGTVCARWRIRKNYAQAKDLSSRDLFVMWWYGANTSCLFRVCLGDFTNGNYYFFEFYDDFSGWARIVMPLMNFTSNGTPEWDNITDVWIEQMTENQIGTWYIDRTVIGVGQLVRAPDTRYDGIYLVNAFTYVEEGGILDSYSYKLELWWEDDYF